MPKVKGGAEGSASRSKIDWAYTLFYAFFFINLMLIALFGMFAET